jgi:hypothetical protein
MTALSGGGFYWPYARPLRTDQATITVDATGEKAAFIGRVMWEGHATSKTIDTTGSSKLGVATSTSVFDNAASAVTLSIQDVNTSGPVAQPDGTPDVQADITTAADTTPALTTGNSWCQVTPTSGTKTLSTGDLIAVVFDMTNRGGVSDSVVLTSATHLSSGFFPVTNAYAAAAWGATGVGFLAGAFFIANDGTLGWLDGQMPHGFVAALTWTDGSATDEYGMIFQVPFDCKVDALACTMRTVDGTSDFIMSLYSTPEATPAVMAAGAATVTVDATQTGTVAAEAFGVWNLASEVSLTANTDYCVAIKASGAGNVRIGQTTLGHADFRKSLLGGTTMRSVNRNGGSGDFGSSSTTVMYPIMVRISDITISSGGARVIGG